MPRVSKTARASSGKTKAGTFSRSADSPILIPLADGEWAYVMTASGNTRHMKTSGDDFIAELVELGDAQRVVETLAAFHDANPSHGWKSVAERFEAAGETTTADE